MAVYHIYGPSLEANAPHQTKRAVAWLNGAIMIASLLVFICGLGCFVGIVSVGISLLI